jgi:hypothetical protein
MIGAPESCDPRIPAGRPRPVCTALTGTITLQCEPAGRLGASLSLSRRQGSNGLGDP